MSSWLPEFQAAEIEFGAGAYRASQKLKKCRNGCKLTAFGCEGFAPLFSDPVARESRLQYPTTINNEEATDGKSTSRG
jgi:hypothetical protein